MTVTATPPITGGVTATPPVTGDVVLSFSPGQVNLPPDSTVKIMADSGTKKVGFTRTVFTFDPAKINLASEITATNPNLSTPVEKTSMAVANQQGKAVIVVASSPSDIPPGGVFELASFTIKAISTVANDTATINFLTSDMQYIDEANQILTLGAIPLSITLNGQNVTVTATPPPGGDFEVPIGSKDVITVDIGGVPGNIPQISFSAELAHTQANPDMYFRLRVKDDLYFVDNPGVVLAPTCNSPSEGEKDFYIPVRAQGNVYKPVASINVPVPSGAGVAKVTADGWVVLEGIAEDRYYTFILKAPKFRGVQVVEHVYLQSGQQSGQVFSWVNNPLEPGDLPNPNDNLLQDCTVNSVDISLMVSRIGSTGGADLKVADVNFDGIVNGNDISKVVNTLSTKPDDDL